MSNRYIKTDRILGSDRSKISFLGISAKPLQRKSVCQNMGLNRVTKGLILRMK